MPAFKAPASWRPALLLLSFVLLGADGAAAFAQTVAPVLVELTPARRVVSVTMTNTSPRAMTYQAQTVDWTQPDGVDRYAETADLLVVPPVAEIAPGASQIFRITLRRPPPAQETAYRLIFEDVTDDTAPAPADGVVLRLQFRHSLPVFAGPAAKSGGHARIAACAEPAPANCVRIYNDGARRMKVIRLVGEGTGWRREIPVSATLLAGSWKQWTFEPPAAGGKSAKVTASTSDGDLSMELPIQGR